MDVATWNVNSLRARMPRLLPWLEERRPDVVCLQETKVADDRFPREPLEDLGYEVVTHGQRSYNGVAILSRRGIEDVVRGLPGDGPDEEARVIGATVAGSVMVVSVYVVNGQSVGSERYEHKLRWMERLQAFLEERYDMREKVVLAGDFNCTFDDRDVHDPDLWRGRILCSEPERAALRRVVDVGLRDALRKFHEEGGHYTWWDYRTRGWERDRGLRIDHVLLSPPAWEACSAVRVDREVRAGERPSDHAPVVATLEE